MASAPLTEPKRVQLPVKRKWKAFRNQLYTFSRQIATSQESKASTFAALKSLFCPAPSPVHATYAHADELCIAFWAFGTPQQQRVLLKFMLQLLRPRIYVASETKTAQIESMFVINHKFLQMSGEDLETWLGAFLDCLGMSAGLVCMDRYLGSAMLTCMDRIEKGSPTSLKHNLPVHPDFLHLYRLRLGMRDEQLQVQLATHGLRFTSTNMIELFMENKRLYDTIRRQNLTERRYNDEKLQSRANNNEAMNIIDALFLTNAINLSTHTALQTLLTPSRENTPQPVALRRLFMAFQQAPPFYSGADVPVTDM